MAGLSDGVAMRTDLTAVRRLLEPTPSGDRPWAMLGAALMAAFAAVAMAGVVVLGPGVRFDQLPPPIEGQP